jgi:hypothetical protein
MAFQDLFLRIKAQDLTGGIFGQLGGRIGQAAQGAGDLSNQIASGVLKANLLTGAFSSAVGVIQQGIGSIRSNLQQAVDLQLEGINAATTFSSLTGSSFEEAATVIENLNNRLAKSAASLPGATQDYKALATTIQDNVLEAFKGLNGELDLKGFEDSVSGISESYGALTAASTRMTGNTALGLTKALSGAGIAELRNIAFFEQNPVILNELEKRLQELGANSLRDLDIRARVKLIEEVGRKFITEDFKQQAGESVDGLIQSFKSTLLDPTTGIFGIMRDLDPATEGTQSAFGSYNEIVKSLIGPDGLFEIASQTLASAGITLTDPMVMLRDGFDFVNGVIQRAIAILKQVQGFFEGGGTLADLDAVFKQGFNPDALRQQVVGFIDQLQPAIADLLQRGIRTLRQLFQGIQRVDFGEIGGQVGLFTAELLGQALKFLVNAPWGQILLFIGEVSIQIIRAAIQLLAGFSASLQVRLRGIILTTLGQIGQNFIKGLRGLFADAGAIVWNWITALPRAVLGALTGVLTNWQQQFQGTLLGAIAGLLGQFTNRVQSSLSQGIPAIARAIWEGLQQLFQGLVQAVRDRFRSTGANLVSRVPSLPSVGQIAANAVPPVRVAQAAAASLPAVAQGAVNLVQQVVGPRYSGQIRPVSVLPPVRITQPVEARYLGHIPKILPPVRNAVNGLFDAVRRESAAKPAGSGLVVANTSETILTPPQRQAYAAGAADAARISGGGNTYSFNPTIILQGPGDMEAHAREILRYFEIFLDEHQQGQLAGG